MIAPVGPGGKSVKLSILLETPQKQGFSAITHSLKQS
jgi:hypothetical protein